MTGFLAALVEKLIAWVVGMIVSAIERWSSLRKKEDAAQKANQQVLDETLNAQTKEERDAAAKDTISHL